MDEQHATVPAWTAPVPLPHGVDDPAELTKALLAHPEASRVHWMRSLGAAQLRRLWTLSELAGIAWPPTSFGQDQPVICVGKNHMPIFSWFHKRIVRVGDETFGFNDTGWLRWLIGDGVFVVSADDEDPTKLWLDYTRAPTAWHRSFPPRRTTSRLLEPYVYGGLKDEVRRVGDGLCIGRSAVTGNLLQRGAWFALWLPTLASDGASS